VLDPDVVAELRSEVQSNKRSTRCQCDVEWGKCPGPQACPFSGYGETCPYSGFEQGEKEMLKIEDLTVGTKVVDSMFPLDVGSVIANDGTEVVVKFEDHQHHYSHNVQGDERIKGADNLRHLELA
jgi:hypothetical protein